MKLLLWLSASLAIIMLLMNPSNITLLNVKSLLALATFMAVSELWGRSGIFTYLAGKLKGLKLALLSYLAGAILMNDAAVFIMVPIATLSEPSSVPYVVALINLGSSISPFGNPQNVIIWTHYSLNPLSFLLLFPLTLPPALASALKLKDLKPRLSAERPKGIVPCFLTLITALILIEANLAPLALVVAVIAYYITFKRVPRIDLETLATLGAMMIGFGGLAKILNVPKGHCFLEALALSQVMSNVPATIMLLGCPWLPLAAGVDLGGLGTPIASLANLIAIKLSDIGTKEFTKAQIPLLLLSTSAYPMLLALKILNLW